MIIISAIPKPNDVPQTYSGEIYLELADNLVKVSIDDPYPGGDAGGVVLLDRTGVEKLIEALTDISRHL